MALGTRCEAGCGYARVMHLRPFALVAVALLIASAARAQGDPEALPERPPLPRWEAGVVSFGATQPAYPGADTATRRALVLPYLVYRGEYLRSDRGGVGVRAVKTARFELDVGFAGSLGSNAADVPARRGMANLGVLVEMGPQLKINLNDVADGPGSSRIELPLRGVFDLNDHLRLRGLAFEPQWTTSTRLPARWVASFNVGGVWGNRKLASTFYDVAPNEARFDRPAYAARGGLISLRAGLSLSRPLGRDLRLFTFVRQESLAGAANRDSPLVRRHSGTSAGVGLTWTLLRSSQMAAD